jgi:hypothetical protein
MKQYYIMKGQTSMEYLMTYGWAILILIVVVMALYSMGIFTTNPKGVQENIETYCLLNHKEFNGWTHNGFCCLDYDLNCTESIINNKSYVIDDCFNKIEICYVEVNK